MRVVVPGQPERAPPGSPGLIPLVLLESEPRRQTELARKALEMSPNCADAYVLLAEYAEALPDELELYEQGVAAGAAPHSLVRCARYRSADPWNDTLWQQQSRHVVPRRAVLLPQQVGPRQIRCPRHIDAGTRGDFLARGHLYRWIVLQREVDGRLDSKRLRRLSRLLSAALVWTGGTSNRFAVTQRA